MTVTLVVPEKWRRQDTLKLEKTHLGRSGSPRRAPSPLTGQVGGWLIGTHAVVPKAGSLQSIPEALWGRPSYFAKKTDEQKTTSPRAPSLQRRESSATSLPAPQGGEQEPDSPLPPLPPGLSPYLLRRLSQPSWEREERSHEQKAPEDSCSPVLRGSDSDHHSEPLSWAFLPTLPHPRGSSWYLPGVSAVRPWPQIQDVCQSFILPLVHLVPLPHHHLSP